MGGPLRPTPGAIHCVSGVPELRVLRSVAQLMARRLRAIASSRSFVLVTASPQVSILAEGVSKPYGQTMGGEMRASGCDVSVLVNGLSGLTARDMVAKARHPTVLDCTGKIGKGCLYHALWVSSGTDLQAFQGVYRTVSPEGVHSSWISVRVIGALLLEAQLGVYQSGAGLQLQGRGQ